MSTLLSTSLPGPVPETCPCCWEKMLLGATQRAGEGAGFGRTSEQPRAGIYKCRIICRPGAEALREQLAGLLAFPDSGGHC